MSNVSLLLNDLRKVQQALSEFKPSLSEKWQTAAVESSIALMNKLGEDIEIAISAGRDDDQKRIACAISGTRKGILELGFLSEKNDHYLIAIIAQLSDRALKICLDPSSIV